MLMLENGIRGGTFILLMDMLKQINNMKIFDEKKDSSHIMCLGKNNLYQKAM